nr:hypothetical protein [Tanacetum cinerariifolium]
MTKRPSSPVLFYPFDGEFSCGILMGYRYSKWSKSNVNVLMMVLHWFFLVSDLKSTCIKVVLENNSFGCLENNIPFKYLGVKVAANMTHINAWNEIIQKVRIKLSKWKAESLSVGDRLTLLKLDLGSLLTYYISLFKAPDGVLSHLERLCNSFFLGQRWVSVKCLGFVGVKLWRRSIMAG